MIEPILKTELSRKLKKAGFEISKDYAGRISGWGSSSEGVRFNGEYPWVMRWQRNYRRYSENRKAPFDKISIEYGMSTFGITSSMRGESSWRKEQREHAEAEAVRLENFIIENRLGYVENGKMFVHLKNPNI